ncbi:uncharacterized protein LOC131990734 [Centropristis striata]|uniref:uncharacterized protein LOC131990734 n=1 Tax=Centropristis striata TaxID=184440 RepID=UPI0027E0AA6F|nr:uncharacterized protein LOC131990734 [Centropristis striata]
MSQIGYIKLSLFVMLLLQFAEVTGQSVTVKAGDDVTLPCSSVMVDQDKCGQTSWLYSRHVLEATGELIRLGQISKDVVSKGKSYGLNTAADCSLVIRNVTAEDVGRYTCRQFSKSGEDSSVSLSVVIMDEHQKDDKVTFFCSVVSYQACGHTVKWLYEGDESDMETIQRPCSAWATFPTHLNHTRKLLKCNVTENKSGEILVYDVATKSPYEKTGNTTVGNNTTSSAKNDTQGRGILYYILYILYHSFSLLMKQQQCL